LPNITALALALLLPGAALAQPPSTPPPSGPHPAASPPPAASPAPAKAQEEEKKNEVVIEGFVGPAYFDHPDVGGLAYGGALRFMKHHGLRTDFGILIHGAHHSAKDVVSAEGIKFDTQHTQLGGGLELNLGFGVSIVEIMLGGGLGLSWVDGTLQTARTLRPAIDYSNHPIFYLSYGGELGVNAGPVRPVVRITKLVDMAYDAGQAGDASALLVLFGVGVGF
jgi:hypothetical protein